MKVIQAVSKEMILTGSLFVEKCYSSVALERMKNKNVDDDSEE